MTALMLVGTTLISAPPASATQSTLERRLIAKINHAREIRGLPPLRARSGLSDYARQHSAEMAGRSFLFHTVDFSAICCWSSIGENVGTGDTVRQLHRAFMASPAHRANILDRRFRAVGVGIVVRNGKLWVSQIFRAPR